MAHARRSHRPRHRRDEPREPPEGLRRAHVPVRVPRRADRPSVLAGASRCRTASGSSATMNTADRSIRSIDVALRRRFDVFECPPDRQILESYFASRTNTVPDLFDGFEALNAALTEHLDRHHTIGHTFLMADPMTPDELGASGGTRSGRSSRTTSSIGRASPTSTSRRTSGRRSPDAHRDAHRVPTEGPYPHARRGPRARGRRDPPRVAEGVVGCRRRRWRRGRRPDDHPGPAGRA